MRNHGAAAAVVVFHIAGAAAAPVVVEDSLGSIPPGAQPATRIVSPDFRQVAEIACNANGCAVHVNGQPGPAFDTIVARTLRFAGGRVAAYAGRRGSQTSVVVGGKVFSLPSPLAPPAFSLNPAVSNDGGKVMAVLQTSNGKMVRTIDTATGAFADFGPYDDVIQPQYGADARSYFVAKRGTEMFVVADGAEGHHYDTVGLVKLSPDGSRVAYTVQSGGVARYAVDAVLSDPLGITSPIVFSPDSSRFGYSTSTPDGPTRYVLDGVSISGPSDGGIVSPVVFSADSRRVGYIVVNTDNRLAYVIDGVTGPFFDKVSDLALWSSATDSKFAYSRENGGRRAIVFTGGATPTYAPKDTLGLTWSADGRCFAYFASQGFGPTAKTVVLINGKRATPEGYAAMGPATFSNTAHQSAHIARSAASTFALIVDSTRRMLIYGLPVTAVLATDSGFAFVVERKSERLRVEWRPK